MTGTSTSLCDTLPNFFRAAASLSTWACGRAPRVAQHAEHAALFTRSDCPANAAVPHPAVASPAVPLPSSSSLSIPSRLLSACLPHSPHAPDACTIRTGHDGRLARCLRLGPPWAAAEAGTPYVPWRLPCHHGCLVLDGSHAPRRRPLLPRPPASSCQAHGRICDRFAERQARAWARDTGRETSPAPTLFKASVPTSELHHGGKTARHSTMRINMLRRENAPHKLRMRTA
eukprot:350388-Chlamydomonas_euryale.AAC.19